METLKQKTAKGLLWGGLNNMALQLVGLVFGIILGRLLDKQDFGMMAMISIFSLVATALQDSGFKTALANEQHPTDRDYNSVFWFNIAVGTLLYLLLFFCAPLIARYYHTDRLVPLCRYAFLSIVIASMGTAQSAWLFKNLRAKQQAKASVAAVLLSSTVGVLMALGGCAYWSLATQGLVYVGVNTLLQWHYSPWRPTFSFDPAPVRRMFRFSCKILATTITTHVNNNVLNILLGRYFGGQAAGVYNQAYQWDFKAFSLVQGMVGQVAQPVLVDLRDSGGRQLAALRKLMRFTSFVAFPLLFGLALVSREFIVLTITAKWLPSARLLQLLCVSGAVMPLCTLLSNLLIARGRSDLYFRCTLVLCLAQLGLMVAIWPLGIHRMVQAYVVLNVGWLFVWQRLAGRLTGYRLWPFLTDTLPFALSAAAVMGVTRWATLPLESSLWLLLTARVVLAVLLYAALMKAARVKILDECVRFMLDRFRRKAAPDGD